MHSQRRGAARQVWACEPGHEAHGLGAVLARGRSPEERYQLFGALGEAHLARCETDVLYPTLPPKGSGKPGATILTPFAHRRD